MVLGNVRRLTMMNEADESCIIKGLVFELLPA